MTRIVGFLSQHGEFTSDKTGEVIVWSNRHLRCISDDGLDEGEYGLKLVSQKLKTSQVCKSLGISVKSTEKEVDEALLSILNCEIEMTVGIVKDEYEVNGFRVTK